MRQASGPSEPAGDEEEMGYMGYNDKGHKGAPLVVSGAGEKPAKSSLTSLVSVLPDCAPLWSAFAYLAY